MSIQFTNERVYIVETRKTKRHRWSKRRYFFTNRRDASDQIRVCTTTFGYYAARMRVWHPVAYKEQP